jgi:hypothetical protein
MLHFGRTKTNEMMEGQHERHCYEPTTRSYHEEVVHIYLSLSLNIYIHKSSFACEKGPCHIVSRDSNHGFTQCDIRNTMPNSSCALNPPMRALRGETHTHTYIYIYTDIQKIEWTTTPKGEKHNKPLTLEDMRLIATMKI